MMVPCEVGLSPIGDLTYAERVKQLLVRLQGEGGYASSEDSNRVLELVSMAYALGLSFAALDAAGDNAFPQLATELLEEHETARRIPNDAPRSISERQTRAAVIDAATPGGGAAGIEAGLARLGITASLVPVSRAQIQSEDSEDDGILQSLVHISAADWTLAKTTAAIDFLRRFLPVVQLGQMQHVSPAEVLVTEVDAVWAPGETVLLGQCSIGADAVGEIGAWDQERTPSRLKSYARNSRLNARDLNAIQDASMLAACSAADNDIGVTLDGTRFYAVAATAAGGGGTAELLSGADFRDRMVRVYLRYSDIDIRPGQGLDTDTNEEPQYTTLWFTGTGGIGYQTGASGIGNLLASATAITYQNIEVGQLYIVGFLEVSGPLTGGTQAQELETFTDGTDLADVLTPAWWANLRDAIAMHPANGAAVDAWAGWIIPGGLHRLAVIGHSTKPGAGIVTRVLDATEDWRDRVILATAVLASTSDASEAFFPGSTSDFFLSFFGTSVHSVMYTRDGDVPCALAFGLALYARASDGALCADHNSTYVGNANASVIVMLRATDQLQERSVDVQLTAPTSPASGEPIYPFQLNWLQDIAMLTQARGKPASIGVAGVECEAMPLGPITSGDPRIPRAWQVRRRDGIANTSRVERRQNVAGSLRRVFACDVPANGDVIIDASHDWRDRFIHGLVGFDLTNDIRPGGTGDYALNVAASQNAASSYLGPGRPSGSTVLASEHYLAVNANQIALYAHATTGALCARNSNGAVLYLAGWVDASFPLGPRSS